MLIATGQPQYLLQAALCGYGITWMGHFVFEKNKPASIKRALYSFMGGLVDVQRYLAGQGQNLEDLAQIEGVPVGLGPQR